MDLKKVLELLDVNLCKRGISRNITICGGAALNLQGITSRSTQDIDVLAPRIDTALKEISIDIASDFNLNQNWLNNGASMFTSEIMPGWEDRTLLIYKGESLKVYSLTRIDLLSMKFAAFYDRASDLKDIISLNPSLSDLEKVSHFIKYNKLHLKNDKSYHDSVDVVFNLICEKVGYGK